MFVGSKRRNCIYFISQQTNNYSIFLIIYFFGFGRYSKATIGCNFISAFSENIKINEGHRFRWPLFYHFRKLFFYNFDSLDFISLHYLKYVNTLCQLTPQFILSICISMCLVNSSPGNISHHNRNFILGIAIYV